MFFFKSAGIEILEDVSPDIVIVCCGGGGLIAGIAAAIKLKGHENTRIYGVEPETGERFTTYYGMNMASA